MAIDNAMTFSNDNAGTEDLWNHFKDQLEKEALCRIEEERDMAPKDRQMRRVMASKSFFKR